MQTLLCSFMGEGAALLDLSKFMGAECLIGYNALKGAVRALQKAPYGNVFSGVYFIRPVQILHKGRNQSIRLMLAQSKQRRDRDHAEIKEG